MMSKTFQRLPAFGIGSTAATSTIAPVPYFGSGRWSKMFTS